MQDKFNPHVASFQKVSYAKEEEVSTLTLDCSDGCNPYGCSPAVMEALRQIQPHDIFEYPHGFDLKDAIIRCWEPYITLQRDMISYCDGSIDGIGMINIIFARDGAKIVGVWPQFTDFANDAKTKGFVYEPIFLERSENYRIVPERIISSMDESVSLVYLDNPNNPTGQSIPLSSLTELLERAKEKGIYVIVDEAYGEYLLPEDSAMTLLNSYDNLIVLRTFSKGLGLAGMRVGYIVASLPITEHIEKISNPYCISTLGRKMAVAAIGDLPFIEKCREQTTQAKKKLRTAVGHHLHMAETLDSCSICFLWHDDTECDLAAAFASYGIKTVAGNGFEGMGSNSVRIRMPAAHQEEQFFRVIKALNES